MLEFFSQIDWVSTIIGAVVGAIIIWLLGVILRLFKPSRQNYHISLYKLGEEATFVSSIKGDLTVDVRYKGESYEGAVSILNIELMNDGKNDISYVNHFNRPILLKSNKYKIINAYELEGTDIRTNVSLNDDNTVSISWDLLKQKESIRVQLIGQLINEEKSDNKVNPYPSFFDSLQFNVRSDCVDYIMPGRLSYKMVAAYLTLFIAIIAILHIFFSLREISNVEEYTFLVGENVVSGALSFDSERNRYVISDVDSLDFGAFDFHKHPVVSVSVTNRRGTAAYLIFSYTAIIAFFWLFAFLFHMLSRSEDRKKVFKL